MIITKTMFQLYLIRLNLTPIIEVEQTIEGFKAVLSKYDKPKIENLTMIERSEKGQFNVFLSKKDIEENELIKNKFFQ